MDELSMRAALRPDGCATSGKLDSDSLSNLSLHERSARLSEHLRKSQRPPGASVALMSAHESTVLEVRWAARRAQLECVEIRPAEAEHLTELLKTSRAQVLFVDTIHRIWVDRLPATTVPALEIIYVDGSAAREIVDGYEWIVSMGEVPARLGYKPQAATGAA